MKQRDVFVITASCALINTDIIEIEVSFLCVCALVDDKLRHNIVEVAVEP